MPPRRSLPSSALTSVALENRGHRANRAVPPDLRRALLDELGEAIERPGSMPASPRLPTAELQPALDRLAIHQPDCTRLSPC